MDYEKKYKEALGWMQSVYPTMTGAVKDDAEHYFPELKESNDEKIRKEIIYFFNRYFSVWREDIDKYKSWLAWLEKQGEQKSIVEMKTPEESLGIDSDTYNKIVDECIYGEQKPTKGAKGNEREIPFSEQKPAWSEEDEDMGDTIIRDLKRLGGDIVNVKPAYKAEIDWLKSLKDRVQPKQEWSKEDEKMFNRCLKTMKGAYYLDGEALYWLENRFKSLKPQNNITDEELAQAKKDAYNDALDKIEYHSGEPTFDDGWSAAIWYFKKRNIIPQNTWKPSDEQMETLENVRKILHTNDIYSKANNLMYNFEELIRTLKKLREGQL